ncbi:MAG: hypothetical protein ACK5HT_21245 [Draconibacterium sp.]
MKTRLNSIIAAAFTLVLLVGNVSAKGNETGTRKVASSHESMKETSLQLENWMKDQHIWDVNNVFILKENAERKIDIENWMKDQRKWDVKTQLDLTLENEPKLKLQDWMKNEAVWKV